MTSRSLKTTHFRVVKKVLAVPSRDLLSELSKIPKSDPVWGRRILAKDQEIDRWRVIPYSTLYEAPDSLRLVAATIKPVEYTDAEEPEDYLAENEDIASRFYDKDKCKKPVYYYNRRRMTYCCVDYDLSRDYPDPEHKLETEPESVAEFLSSELRSLDCETFEEASVICSPTSPKSFASDSAKLLILPAGLEVTTEFSKESSGVEPDFEFENLEDDLRGVIEKKVDFPMEEMMISLRETFPEFRYPLPRCADE